MSAPRRREYIDGAPVPVARPKRSWLRRHWLTGALFCGLLVFATRTGTQLFETEAKLQDARLTRTQLEAKVSEAERQKETLEQQLNQQTSDAYMELAAKKLGFVYHNETVYQKGK